MATNTSSPVVFTPDEWATRLVNTQPAQWFSDAAKSPGGVLYSIFYAIGEVLQAMQSGLEYAYDSTYLQTAVGAALDTAAVDYLGVSFLRLPGESDAAFSSRIRAGLIVPAATYQAVYDVVAGISSEPPSIIVPWDLSTTGTFGAGFYDVPDGNAGGLRYTPCRPYECLIIAQPSGVSVLNGNSLDTYDAGFYDSPTMFLGNVVVSGGVDQLFQVLEQVAPLGVALWVQIGYNSVIAPSGVFILGSSQLDSGTLG